MKRRDIIRFGIITLALVAAMTTGCLSASAQAGDVAPTVKEAQYKNFAGKVQEYTPDATNATKGAVTLVNEEGGEFVFTITHSTYLASDDEIKIGVAFIGWYDATGIMTLQYPPKMPAKVALVGGLASGENVKVEKFDENLVSYDNDLKLNMAVDTPVFTMYGDVFGGELKDRNLMVYYGPSTRSIPAQTSPIKVIVLDAIRMNGSPDQPTNQPAPDQDEAVFVTTARLHMRADASGKALSLGVLPKCESVNVFGYEGKWAKAVVNGKLVYLYSDYLR